MIKHIVMWRLKDEAEGGTKKENALKVKELLEGLKDKIEEIKFIEVGINIEPTAAAYDVVLYSEFETLEDLDIYQNHEEHKKVAAFIGAVRSERVVVDYKA